MRLLRQLRDTDRCLVRTSCESGIVRNTGRGVVDCALHQRLVHELDVGRELVDGR